MVSREATGAGLSNREGREGSTLVSELNRSSDGDEGGGAKKARRRKSSPIQGSIVVFMGSLLRSQGDARDLN
jgi:hypothetical protein